MTLMNSNSLANQKGFTLIEVMIALAVLVIGVLGAFSMQLITIKGNSNAIAVTRSVQESSAALDTLESLTYADGKLDAGTGKTMTTLFGAAPQFASTVTYDVAVNNNVKALFALQHDDFPGEQAKIITVSSVQRVAGVDKTITLQYVKID